MSKRQPQSPDPDPTAARPDALEQFRERADDTALTTDQGVKISHTDDSLKAGERGPTEPPSAANGVP